MWWKIYRSNQKYSNMLMKKVCFKCCINMFPEETRKEIIIIILLLLLFICIFPPSNQNKKKHLKWKEISSFLFVNLFSKFISFVSIICLSCVTNKISLRSNVCSLFIINCKSRVNGGGKCVEKRNEWYCIKIHNANVLWWHIMLVL